MADEVTLGELARTQAAFERRIEAALKAGDDRHADLAGKMVPTDLWKAEHEALEDDVKELRDDVREAVARIERTSLERRAVLDAKIDAVNKRIDAHEKAHAEKSAWSRSKTLTVIGIVVTAAAAIAAAWIGAIVAAKGVH